jgi:predicted Rossmann fold flavoprotein
LKQKFDAVIIGAGAAGLFCAMEAGKRGRRVALLEHADRVGKKILISGGGRCNFTNIHTRPDNFISANPHFAKSALARFTPADFIALVEKHRIAYHEKTLGQLFCDRSAQEIVSMLEAECTSANISTFLNCRILGVQRADGFTVQTASTEFHAPVLVIAAGGLSIPKMGATSFGYDLARQFGLKIIPTKPGLVPLVLSEKDRKRYCDLAGVSSEVIASAADHAFREKFLFTHRGLSGPAILQISSYWQKDSPIHLDIAPGCNVTEAIQGAKFRTLTAARNALQGVLPKRFAERWLEWNGPSAWTNQGIAELEDKLHDWQIIPTTTEGYEKAEVTTGGVDTGELSSKTMESKRVPGLYFIGEVVDVTGHLGGFNFQWAWASAAAAGRAF